MTIVETSNYSLAISNAPVAPALDLEEFLAKGEWQSTTNFAEHQQLILSQGRKFLSLAAEGRAIGVSAVNEGKLGVDLPAIKAYLISYKAYKKNRELRKYPLDKILSITSSVLDRIIIHIEQSDTQSRELILPQNEVDVARRFFLSLSTISIKYDE